MNQAQIDLPADVPVLRQQLAFVNNRVQTLEREAARLQAQLDAVPHTPGQMYPHPDAKEIGSKLGDVKNELIALGAAQDGIQKALATAEPLIGADHAAQDAQARIDVAYTEAAVASGRVESIDAAIERMRAALATERDAEAAARDRVVHDAAKTLGEEVAGFLGRAAKSIVGKGALSAEQHAARAASLEAAIANAQAERDTVTVRIEQASRLREAAEEDLRAAQAKQAEYRHLEALSAYVAALAELRIACVPLGYTPETPDVSAMADAIIAEAAAA